MAVQAHFLSALCLLQVCPSIYHSRRDAARATVVSGIILGHGSGVLASLRQTDIHPHARTSDMRQEKHSLTSCAVAHFFFLAFPSRPQNVHFHK